MSRQIRKDKQTDMWMINPGEFSSSDHGARNSVIWSSLSRARLRLAKIQTKTQNTHVQTSLTNHSLCSKVKYTNRASNNQSKQDRIRPAKDEFSEVRSTKFNKATTASIRVSTRTKSLKAMNKRKREKSPSHWTNLSRQSFTSLKTATTRETQNRGSQIAPSV